MTTQDFPSIYELSTIAAILHRQNKGNLSAATKDALNLWFAAAEELKKARTEVAIAESGEMLFLGKDNDSPAMAWINSHAKSPLDRFKRFKSFAKAWADYDTTGTQGKEAIHRKIPPAVPAHFLQAFLDTRIKKRLVADAKRHGRKRAAKSVK